MKKMRDVIYRVWIDPKRYQLKRPVRMTLLADLHSNQIGKENKILIQRIIQFDPDLVLVAGDLIVGEAGSDTTTARKLLEQLRKKYIIYYENGNHEHRMKVKPEIYGETYKEYERWLLDRGVHFLENDREEIEIAFCSSVSAEISAEVTPNVTKISLGSSSVRCLSLLSMSACNPEAP